MKILAFFAHPDDETMLCGGTLAALAEQGHAVHILLATRGEGGELGDPPLAAVEQLGEVREAEARCAAQALGSATIDFLPYVDPRIGPDDTLYAYESDFATLVSEVAGFIKTYDCDVVLGHGSNGEYGHPAHLLSHAAVKAAVESLPPATRPILYTVQAAYEGHPKTRVMNKDDAAHLVLDIAPYLEKKISAALCHTTQHALFIRRPSEAAGRRMTVNEIVIGEESLHRVFPPWQEGDQDELYTTLKFLAKPIH